MGLKPPFQLTNKPQLLIVDGGGTLFDPRSVIPIYAFQRAFIEKGLEVELETIIKHMGRTKKEHIRLLLNESNIKSQLLEKGKKNLDAKDIDQIYENFKKHLYFLAEETEEIDGVKEVVYSLKEAKIPLILTTGYDAKTVNIIKKKLSWLDDVLTHSITSSDVKRGRPFPFMIFKAMEFCLIKNSGYALKIGDTKVDMEAADNAHMCGIIVTSGILTNEKIAEKTNEEIGRKHLILPSLKEVIEYILDGTLIDRIVNIY